MIRLFVFTFFLINAPSLFATAFDDAQSAARKGQYKQVVAILSDALDARDLDLSQEVIAYSNRGIAYSLLKAYGLAKADLQKAIELNPDHRLTQNHLGILAEHVEGDYTTAFKWYEEAALAGFSASQVNLANLYQFGLGIEKNNARALEYYLLAAESDYALAFVPIGVMHMEGRGITRNYEEGIQWLRKGIDNGIIEANYYVAQALEQGHGVERDLKQAASLYHAAAMQGHGKAQNSLGYLYRRGAGVERDFLEAVKWYRLAADQGVNQAANRLAWLLATCPTKDVCNGDLAVDLAKTAVSEKKTASNLDSLAAAYARVGEFDKAIATIQQIMKMKNTRQSRYAGRLDLYEQGIPYQL